ncbi:MAG: hypothetical protein A4C66_13225 [Nitrospira sp. HN-bin3]|uniref:hypothetical protein n=1 Tax=Nitrospira cf. moscoviensis SBR1015 TaxID=96242 RepID=UPI000A0C13BE|nr:hypothetical protein [Nitrospira cf. moscoviensis SBR1015]OQW33693.1 MAG: hypothetical protein A4C66_13225 [Nitrospira sp. HN-bin3]
MRTTVTLDRDVAARLKGLRKRRDQTFKEVVNSALRVGLDHLETPATKPSKPYALHPVSLGPRLPNLDNIAEVLAAIEDEQAK